MLSFAAARRRAPCAPWTLLQALLRCAKTVKMPHNGLPTTVRVGIHTGPVVTGLIGSKLPKFSVFGQSVLPPGL